MFNFLLQQAKAKTLDTGTYEGNMLEQVKTILSKAVDAYHSLFTAGKGQTSYKSSGYFNVVC